jgi:hypothetical protein|eukprot:226781_1
MSQHFEDADQDAELNAKWNVMFEELKKYKEEYGDTNVPLNFDANPKLANWVQFLRWSHRRYEVGKIVPGGLNKQKKLLLESIGFQWITFPSCNSRSQSFD